jgi:hypothetical protein
MPGEGLGRNSRACRGWWTKTAAVQVGMCASSSGCVRRPTLPELQNREHFREVVCLVQPYGQPLCDGLRRSSATVRSPCARPGARNRRTLGEPNRLSHVAAVTNSLDANPYRRDNWSTAPSSCTTANPGHSGVEPWGRLPSLRASGAARQTFPTGDLFSHCGVSRRGSQAAASEMLSEVPPSLTQAGTTG